MRNQKYFLPYQIDWVKDRSQVKIWEKSRRIGATYTQAYEDVKDCIEKTVPAVWFSSADDSAAKEYIEYCKMWAEVWGAAFKTYDEEVVDNQTTHTVRFKNGTKITALASNPKSFRSKGGKVVIDEFAFHDDARALWKAANAAAGFWGHPIRILSTHNGKNSLFYSFIQKVIKGELDWSHHKVDIYDAVDQGVYDKVVGRKTTEEERAGFIQKLRRDSFTEDIFLEEYCCEAVDESTAFLTYDLIESVSRDLDEQQAGDGDLFVGVDIGRRNDLTVIWELVKKDEIKHTKKVTVLAKMPFKQQRKILFDILSNPKMRRAAIDGSGLGMQLAEEAQDEFGKARVEAIDFTARVKEQLAFSLKNTMEDKRITVPDEKEVREDLHSVKKVVGLSGNIRFDAARDQHGHADRFWALALGNYAGTNITTGAPVVKSKRTRKSSTILKGY